jgi:starch-binding outer membrane protein, SusD/RagB family
MEQCQRLGPVFQRAYLLPAGAGLRPSLCGGNSRYIPLKLSADIGEKIERASLSQTYDQILADLKTAALLLPLSQPVKTRPSKPAAYAMLARVYLSMQQYEKAWLYADSCLQLYNSLLDYNALPVSSNSPFPKFNKEVIFYALVQSNPNHFFTPGNARIDTVLYASYASDDLRRSLFFRPREPGLFSFKGSYDGSSLLFVGLATDEVYLIRAECFARTGSTQAAMNDLNTLLVTRWKAGTFVPYTATTPTEALQLVLAERRKQLLMRGLRWTDLRRLNTEPGFAKTIQRLVNGQLLALPPNDDRYTWPLPPDVMGFNPSLPQNPR